MGLVSQAKTGQIIIVMSKTTHIIVIAAFLLGIIAPACNFAWGGKFSVVEICTAQGIEQKLVENKQQPDRPPAMEDNCSFCIASVTVKIFVPDIILAEKQIARGEKIRFRLYEATYLSRLSKTGQPRAPPQILV
jgi:hypothetical protein